VADVMDLHDIRIERRGRFFYELTHEMSSSNPEIWVTMETRPSSYVVGARWARSKARRMLRAALR
jgi:hypothetical protein